MAAVDNFELRFSGTGACMRRCRISATTPSSRRASSLAPVPASSGRAVDPQTPLVISLTQVHGGNVGNIVPADVRLQGTCRFLDPMLSDLCELRIGEIARGIASAHRLAVELDYVRGYPPVINTAAPVAHAAAAAASAVGPDNVVTKFPASLGCEDFAYMVRAVGGAYAWIGAGAAAAAQGLHGDRYDFNDNIVPIARSHYYRSTSRGQNHCLASAVESWWSRTAALRALSAPERRAASAPGRKAPWGLEVAVPASSTPACRDMSVTPASERRC